MKYAKVPNALLNYTTVNEILIQTLMPYFATRLSKARRETDSVHCNEYSDRL